MVLVSFFPEIQHTKPYNIIILVFIVRLFSSHSFCCQSWYGLLQVGSLSVVLQILTAYYGEFFFLIAVAVAIFIYGSISSISSCFEVILRKYRTHIIFFFQLYMLNLHAKLDRYIIFLSFYLGKLEMPESLSNYFNFRNRHLLGGCSCYLILRLSQNNRGIHRCCMPPNIFSCKWTEVFYLS